jgi:hypothetical protein
MSYFLSKSSQQNSIEMFQKRFGAVYWYWSFAFAYDSACASKLQVLTQSVPQTFASRSATCRSLHYGGKSAAFGRDDKV